jgi:hypothetical protein
MLSSTRPDVLKAVKNYSKERCCPTPQQVVLIAVLRSTKGDVLNQRPKDMLLSTTDDVVLPRDYETYFNNSPPKSCLSSCWAVELSWI